LQFLADVFFTTKNLYDNRISKVFHDYDWGFIFEDDGHGNAKPWLLQHYVGAIKYLMDNERENLLYMNDENGKKIWKRKKKDFLNNLFGVMRGQIEKTQVVETPDFHMHKTLTKCRYKAVNQLQKQYPDIYIEPSNRFKSAKSTNSKQIGKNVEHITDKL
jgi:hypothetical protein